jgi:hypothetical protein
LVGVLRHRIERDAALSLPDRFLLPTEVRQRETEADVPLRTIGRCAKLLLESLPYLLGVGAHVCGIALQGISLNEAEGPGAQVVVERARGQPQQKLSLLLVEDPDEGLTLTRWEFSRVRHPRPDICAVS